MNDPKRCLMSRKGIWAASLALMFMSIVRSVAIGQEENRREMPNRPRFERDLGSRDSNQRGMNAEQRAMIMEYVKKHNPPAARLLNQLERASPTQFKKAMLSIERDIEKLRSFEARDPERFELAIKQWRNRTNIEILLAQVAHGEESPRVHQQLRRLLDEQRTIRRELATLELAALEKRAERLREQIAKLDQGSDADQQHQVEEMIRRAKQSAQKSPRGTSGEENNAPADQLPRKDK